MATLTSKAEKSFIQAALLAEPPLRRDGRGLHDYRPISLRTNVSPLANGSASVVVGGTEVLAAARLEVETLSIGKDAGGCLSCEVTCSPGAYPHLSPQQQDELQQNYTSLLQSVLGHKSLSPPNLVILQHKKAWKLQLDAVILSDAGNLYDVLFLACRAALWDTRIPKTRAVEYRAANRLPDTEDDEMQDGFKAAIQTRKEAQAADFELEDNWDDGDPLSGREKIPVCITMSIHSTVHIVDATSIEEQAVPLRLLLFFAAEEGRKPVLQGTRMLGPGQIALESLAQVAKQGEMYAVDLVTAITAQMTGR